MFSIFGDKNKRAVKKLQIIVDKINFLEKEFGGFLVDDLRRKTLEFKERLKKGETLDDILPEAFAAVRRSAQLTLGMRHYDVQLIGGMVLHQGKIAEMKTGEGKTLVATLPAYLNALAGNGVHIVTVNDYLAKRDASWMGQVYDALGLSVGCVNHGVSYLYSHPASREAELDKERDEDGSFKVADEFLRSCSRKEAYAADLTFCTNNELGFDYLRDNMAPSEEEVAGRGTHFAIVDEVDSILIDEARTPLIISAPHEDSTGLYAQFAKIIPHLKENEHFNIDEKMRAVTLTETGIDKVESLLGIGNIYDTSISGSSGLRYVHHLEQALRAHALFKKDKDYVVKAGEVIIVDEFTGRLMPGRRYSEGLHQAIEAKEGVMVQRESRTLASITFQNYFRLYKKLSGMSGTADTSEEEFIKVFGVDVVKVPSNKPSARQDFQDLVYKNEKGKFKALIEEIKKLNETGRPALVGTVSIEKNEYLSELLNKEGIKHEVLNAKNHQREGEIIAQAGKFGAVTIATNMAGRGVDIILGGSPYNEAEAKRVRELGGLAVFGTERHESRRIDNQLRGRAGRQGDPGSSQFLISMDDELMRIFGAQKIKSMMDTLGVPDDQPIKNPIITRSIESAQKKVEGFNFDSRNYVLQYDEVMNRQREAVYSVRRDILKAKETKEKVLEYIDKELGDMVSAHTQDEYSEKWNLKEIFEDVRSIMPAGEDLLFKIEEFSKAHISPRERREKVEKYLKDVARELYEKKENELGSAVMRQAEKAIMLRSIDALWMDHLEGIDYLKDSVRLRAYGQKDPLVEFKNESHIMFEGLLGAIGNNIANTIYKIGPITQVRTETPKNISLSGGGIQESGKPAGAAKSQKVERNDPCPCGSGKKYKKCHGK
ncbi:preprotein translocase subunit SecA [Candidatus Azambacteria bacterium]|nr:preprotein translocase subunit SecA [Candidatus Azambacteria bacterium]